MPFLVELLLALLPTKLPSSCNLPTCGIQAFNEAFQYPITCSQRNIETLCDDSNLLSRYLGSLSTYCAYGAVKRQDVPSTALSDYELAIHYLDIACPNLDINQTQLAKRQASGTPTTTTPVVVTSTTAAAATTTTPTTPTTTAAGTTTAAAGTTTAAAGTTTAAAGTTTAAAGTTTAAAGTTTKPAVVSSQASSAATAPASSSTSIAPPLTISGLTTLATNTLTGGSTASLGGGSSQAGSSSGTITGSGGTTIAAAANASPSKVTTDISIPATVAVGNLVPYALQTISSGTGTTVVQAPNPTVSLPTTTYTGQRLLVSTCTTPMYTAVPLADGSYIALPIVGCQDQNPSCCPSLSSHANPAAQITKGPVLYDNPIASALDAAPITSCPADYTSTASACCPIGFSMYNQAIFSQTPCYSLLPQTIAVPSEVAQQIASLNAQLAAAAASPTASVRVIVDQMFSLSLPLKNGKEKTGSGGLSTGAKAGIGVGAGVLVILFAIVAFWLLRYRRRTRGDPVPQAPPPTTQPAAQGQAPVRGSVASSNTAAMSHHPSWLPKSPRDTILENPAYAGQQSAGGWAPYQDNPQHQQHEPLPPHLQHPSPPLQPQYFRPPPQRQPYDQFQQSSSQGYPGADAVSPGSVGSASPPPGQYGQHRMSELASIPVQRYEADSGVIPEWDERAAAAHQQQQQQHTGGGYAPPAYEMGIGSPRPTYPR